MEIENYYKFRPVFGEGDEGDDEENIEENKKAKQDWKDLVIDICKVPTKKFSELNDIDIPFNYDIINFLQTKDGYEGYLSTYSQMEYFTYRYQQLNGFHPNIFRIEEVEFNLFIHHLFKHFNVPTNCFSKSMFQGEFESKMTNFAICFSKTLLLFVDEINKAVLYYDPKDEKNESSLLYTLLGLLKSFKKPEISKNKIFIVYRSSHGFDKIGFTVKKVNINIKENYNDDFQEVSEKIIKGLNDKDKTHLVILHGVPGVGKSFYIRYLTSKLTKKIIFIPPDMVSSITDPSFIPFLMKNNDSILIIEDAEPALEKRMEGSRSSAVSNVLNLTDGLLSDCLNISIIATFNTGSKNIDEALIRKGRLLMNYKFEKLSVEKSKALLEKLGHKEVEVKEPMTLSDIYFYGVDNNVKEKRKKLGFAQNE